MLVDVDGTAQLTTVVAASLFCMAVYLPRPTPLQHTPLPPLPLPPTSHPPTHPYRCAMLRRM